VSFGLLFPVLWNEMASARIYKPYTNIPQFDTALFKYCIFFITFQSHTVAALFDTVVTLATIAINNKF
jgi:hypothetical protein